MHIVVINSCKIAEELIEGRPELYNDQPVLPIIDPYACFPFEYSELIHRFCCAGLDGGVMLQ